MAHFLNYVEIRTKTLTTIPFLIGTGYAVFRYGSLGLKQMLLCFVSLLLFDMTITAINKHTGSRREGKTPHYPAAVSLAIILAMTLTAIGIGLYLVYISNIVILLVGFICFAAGITYSYGFLPVERTPLGDVVASVVAGGLIPFVAVQIQNPLIDITLHDFSRVVVSADWVELLALFVLAMPLVCCIFAISFANNLCDLEDDVRVQKYTLVFHIGREKTLFLFRLAYIFAYLFIAIGAVLRLTPVFTLLVLLTCIPVRKNVKRFLELQDNEKTFFTVILNFIAINVPYAVLIWLGALLQRLI